MRTAHRTLIATILTVGAVATPALAQQRSWRGPATLVTESGAQVQLLPPDVAIEDDGGAIVAWTRLGADPAVFASTRPTADASFGSPRRLSAPCDARCTIDAPVVAMNRVGDAAVTWQQSPSTPETATTVYAATLPATGPVGPATAVSDPHETTYGQPAVVVDASGRAVVAFDDADRLMHVRTRPAGGDWSASAVVGGPAIRGGGRPSLSVGPDGRMALAWPVADCGGRFARATAAGIWDTPRSPTPTGCADSPVVALDGTGGLHMAWTTWDGYTRHLEAADASAGGDLGPATVLGTDSGGGFERRTLRVLDDGGLAVGWFEAEYRPTVARRSSGGAWHTALPLKAPGGAVAVGAGGTAATARFSFSGLPVRASVSDPGDGAWGAQMDATGAGGGAPALAVYPSGEVLLAATVDAPLGTPPAARWSAVRVSEFTDRSLTPLVVPQARVTRLRAPATSPAGALAPLRVTTDAVMSRALVRVQRRTASGWHTIRTIEDVDTPEYDSQDGTLVTTRLTAVGRHRLRVLVGDATTAPSAVVRVTRPARPHRAVPEGTAAIADGDAGVWMRGAMSVTRVDEATGLLDAPVSLATTGGQGLTVGAAAVWVPTGEGVDRVDAAAGTVTPTAFAGGARGVVASGEYVWALGLCEPADVPRLELCHPRSAARLDAATGTPTGTRLHLTPMGSVDAATVAGDVMWVWGEAEGEGDDGVIAGVSAADGTVTRPVRTVGGRPGGAWVLRPTAATLDRLWADAAPGAPTATPRPVPTVLLPGFRAVSLIRTSPTRGWMLQQHTLRRLADRDERLVQVDLVTGRRTGKVIPLGITLDHATTVTARNGVAWVLRPTEATLERVPLPR